MKEKLVEKLFHSTCTEKELEILFGLMEQDPTPPQPKLIDKLWEEVEAYPKLKEAVSSRIYFKVLSKINQTETALSSSTAKLIDFKPKRKKALWIAGIAASILLLVAGGIWWKVNKINPTVIQTAFGEKQTLELSDGSRVQLNANSQMIFDNNWVVSEAREVKLKGEAFFEVEKEPQTQQKFQVITNDLIIEVLGTTFNVNSHGDKTSVYLKEGQIRLYLQALDSTILMAPGDLIIYSKQNRQIIRKQKELAALHTSWKDGVLTFKSTPLREVLPKIEDIYGVKFKMVKEANYDREVDFPLPIDELETAISILDITFTDFEIRKEGDYYVIE